MPIGQVTLEYGDGTTLTLSRVNARASAASYDRQPFRAPYGTALHVSGSGARGPEEVTLAFDITNAEGIVPAAGDVTDLLANLDLAALVTTPVGVFVNAGVLRHYRAPIEMGYRVDVTILSRGNRAADDSRVLRFMSGRVWEVR